MCVPIMWNMIITKDWAIRNAVVGNGFSIMLKHGN